MSQAHAGCRSCRGRCRGLRPAMTTIMSGMAKILVDARSSQGRPVAIGASGAARPSMKWQGTLAKPPWQCARDGEAEDAERSSRGWVGCSRASEVVSCCWRAASSAGGGRAGCHRIGCSSHGPDDSVGPPSSWRRQRPVFRSARQEVLDQLQASRAFDRRIATCVAPAANFVKSAGFPRRDASPRLRRLLVRRSGVAAISAPRPSCRQRRPPPATAPHRLLDEVGGGALHRRVDRGALALAAAADLLGADVRQVRRRPNTVSDGFAACASARVRSM